MHRILLWLVLVAIADPSHAQAYPSKPIRLIVPFPPAGAADLLSRTLAEKLTETGGYRVIVDNRPGAGGNLGAELVAKAPPDGYTALMAAIATHAIAMTLVRKPGYQLDKDLASVSLVANVPHILISHPAVPARNVKELIAVGKSRPNALNFASAGSGTLSHLEQELLKQMGGFTALHVPYKGTALATTDVLAGHVDVSFDSIPSALPHVRSGKIRALGVASSIRSPAIPDVPTIGEFVRGYAADSWFGVMMPAATSREIIARFNLEVQKALALQELKERLYAIGGFVSPGRPEQLAERVKTDIAKWSEVVRRAGITLE